MTQATALKLSDVEAELNALGFAIDDYDESSGTLYLRAADPSKAVDDSSFKALDELLDRVALGSDLPGYEGYTIIK